MKIWPENCPACHQKMIPHTLDFGNEIVNGRVCEELLCEGFAFWDDAPEDKFRVWCDEFWFDGEEFTFEEVERWLKLRSFQ